MKRSLQSSSILVGSSMALVAASYGVVRYGYGLALPDAQADLGVTDRAGGVIGSLGSLCYCAAMLLGIALAARRPRLVVALSGTTGTLGSLGVAFAPTPAAFAVAAVTASAAAGLASPATMQLVTTHLAPHARPVAQGVVNGGTGPGLVLAAVLALLLAPHWRGTWVVGAVVMAVAALVTWRAAAAAPPFTSRDDTSGVRAPARWWPSRDLLRAYAAGGVLGAGSAAVWTYGRAHFEGAWLLTPTESVLAWGALGAGGAGAVLSAGVVAGWSVRTGWLVAALATAGATAVVSAPGASGAVGVAACLVFGWGFTSATTVLIHWATTVGAENGAGAVGGAASALFVTLVAGQSVGAAVLGVAVGHVPLGSGFAAAAVVGLLAAVLARGAPVRRTPLRSGRDVTAGTHAGTGS